MPLSYAEIFESFPPDLRLPLARLIDTFNEELKAARSDSAELRTIVHDLAEAQKRAEITVKELAEAQKRTEQRLERLEKVVEELAEAQKRAEITVKELAEAQKRTEQRLERLEKVVEELAEAQKRTERALEELTNALRLTEGEVAALRREVKTQIGGLGARWGIQTEEAFRQGMRAVLHEVGFTTDRFLDYDSEGVVSIDPDQVELDVVIKNGKIIVIEIKSSLTRQDTRLFNRKVAFYTQKTGRQVDRKLIITPYAEDKARAVAHELGIEIYTDINALV